MTDTAREAAIERVRAYVTATGVLPANHAVSVIGDRDRTPQHITLGDLRLLLCEAPVTAGVPDAWIEAVGEVVEAHGNLGEIEAYRPNMTEAIKEANYRLTRGVQALDDLMFALPAPPTGEGGPQGEES